MRYEVIAEFNSTTQRFAPGMVVDAAEIDSPVPVERWVEMGRIKALPDPKPDLPTTQAALRDLWVARSSSGDSGPPTKGEVVFITDQSLYGTLISDPDGPTVDVHVFGEDEVRRYPMEAFDRGARAVRGGFSQERLSRRAQSALGRAAAERAAETSSAEP